MNIGGSTTTLLLQQVGWLLHESLAPELHAKILVLVELLSELITLLQQAHQPEKLVTGDLGIDIVVGEELVDCLDHEQLQNAVGDDTVEEATACCSDGCGLL
jgi:hypothetical protein